jgi:hypothetical protein
MQILVPGSLNVTCICLSCAYIYPSGGEYSLIRRGFSRRIERISCLFVSLNGYFIGGLFNGSLSCSAYMASNDKIFNHNEIIGKNMAENGDGVA